MFVKRDNDQTGLIPGRDENENSHTLEQPMLSEEEIAELQNESREAMREFRRQLKGQPRISQKP